jgi:hypothetical protein
MSYWNKGENDDFDKAYMSLPAVVEPEGVVVKYKRPWAIYPDTIDVSPRGTRIVAMYVPDRGPYEGKRIYTDGDGGNYFANQLMEMDADVWRARAAMDDLFGKNIVHVDSGEWVNTEPVLLDLSIHKVR